MYIHSVCSPRSRKSERHRPAASTTILPDLTYRRACRYRQSLYPGVREPESTQQSTDLEIICHNERVKKYCSFPGLPAARASFLPCQDLLFLDSGLVDMVMHTCSVHTLCILYAVRTLYLLHTYKQTFACMNTDDKRECASDSASA